MNNSTSSSASTTSTSAENVTPSDEQAPSSLMAGQQQQPPLLASVDAMPSEEADIHGDNNEGRSNHDNNDDDDDDDEHDDDEDDDGDDEPDDDDDEDDDDQPARQADPAELINVSAIANLASNSPDDDFNCFHELSLVFGEKKLDIDCGNHSTFLPFAIEWLERCRKYLSDNRVFDPQAIMDSPNEHTKMVLSATCCILENLSNILDVLKYSPPSISSACSTTISALTPVTSSSSQTDIQSSPTATSSALNTNTRDTRSTATNAATGTSMTDDEANDLEASLHIDWIDKGPNFTSCDDDDESSADDSDNESLSDKLCTFTLTKKDFVNQHWYHCYTCSMIDVVGICSVCARVCHKDHDISYAKYGAFFCDCSGKENSTCQALVKRPRTTNAGNATRDPNLYQISDTNTSAGPSIDADCRSPSLSKSSLWSETLGNANNESHQRLINNIEPVKNSLIEILSKSRLCDTVAKLLSDIIPAYVRFAQTLNKQVTKRRKTNLKSPKKPDVSDSKPTFPVDFFENLQVLNDVDFGGPDVLSIYSVEQLKTRLNTAGMQITCVKPTGFSIDIINNDPNIVVCGIRVQVGYQDLTKSPTSIEIFGRNMPLSPLTPRWYDVPLTREESVLAERKLSIHFGSSGDPNGITRVETIKVYGKSKESFNWPDESDKNLSNGISSGEDLLDMFLSQESGSKCQNLLTHSLETLDCCLAIAGDLCLEREKQEKLAKELSTSLLIAPYSPQALKAIKSLLTVIYGSKQNYILQRDKTAMDFVMSGLKSLDEYELDTELFSRVISIMKSLSLSKQSNLIKLTEYLSKIVIEKQPSLAPSLDSDSAKMERLIYYLYDLFEQLFLKEVAPKSNTESNPQQPVGQINFNESLQPFIELIYISTLYDLSIMNAATGLIIKFLLNKNLEIALCSRNTLIRLTRVKPSQQTQLATDLKQSSSKDQQQSSTEGEVKLVTSDMARVKQQHLLLLDSLIDKLETIREVGGYRSVSLLHVILVLVLDLDSSNELDESILKKLVQSLRQELLWKSEDLSGIAQTTSMNEVKLVIMRMFSVLLSKVRFSSIASSITFSSRTDADSCWSAFCCSVTAQSLMESNVIEFCYNVLKSMLSSWKTYSDECQANGSMVMNDILPSNQSSKQKSLPKSSPEYQLLESSPFFCASSIRGQVPLIFEEYKHFLSEMALRLPYQVKKVSCSSSNALKPVVFSTEWTTLLCEYLMISLPPLIKKNVRKLLTYICGSKEKYRQLRDFHFLESHMNSIKQIGGYIEDDSDTDNDTTKDYNLILDYESSTLLVDHFKSCIGIAQARCINWQAYCLIKDQQLLSLLMRMVLEFDEDIAHTILELVELALSPTAIQANQSTDTLTDAPIISTSSTECIGDESLKDTAESLGFNLSQQLITQLPKESLSKMIQHLLFEKKHSILRWQAHTILSSLWTNFNPDQQADMLDVLWSLWHLIPKYGRKASQFVDLVGFFTLKNQNHNEEFDVRVCEETLRVLTQQNQMLIHHPNAHIYTSIQSLVDLDCYYLENEPCSVCNSPEIPYTMVKLTSIKVDSKFTTTTQIIKLNGSHTILRISLRISDIKRSKMVKTICIYYNNRSIQSFVEVKNKAGFWHLARKFCLSPSQTDVKIEFTLPITACNLMIEFSEFYENSPGPSETLQCPRCSTAVAANPGVCGNCGENVFQCHKCRAINYDEKDPFLCISCGFCKYARFDINLATKPTCAVEPIESEDDRKKAVASIGALLDKADRVYKSLVQNKPALELLLLRINEQVSPDGYIENMISSDQPLASLTSSTNSAAVQTMVMSHGYAGSPPTHIGSSVNKMIQSLAQKYCVECKSLFEELSKTSHMILAYRKEIVEYDNKQLRRCVNSRSTLLTTSERRKSKVYSSLSTGSGKCYGCASATVEHCITILKALSNVDRLRSRISGSDLVTQLTTFNLKSSSRIMSREVRELLCLLTKGDLKSTTILTNMLMDKITTISKQDYQPSEISYIVRHEISLLASTLEIDDQCFELRLRCLIKIFAFSFQLDNPSMMKSLLIPCLKILLSIIRPNMTTRRNKDRCLENIASVRSDKFRNCLLLEDWLDSETCLFDSWRKRGARSPASFSKTSSINLLKKQQQQNPMTKEQTKENYLSEKYGHKWCLLSSKMSKCCDPIVSIPNNWLKMILFDQSSKTVRLMAKSLVEALFTVKSRKREIIDLLTSYLSEISQAGESAQEFYVVYKNIILTDHWRYYLVLKGILPQLGTLITQEIDNLQELEESTFNSSLALGCSLRMLVEILTSFVSVPKIRSNYKSKLVGFVLNGYLSLRKLVVQRTRVIDETQEMMLDMLEGMTSGSEEETSNFISICVDAIKNCSEGDIRTPVYIFERLCSTIHPEENTNNEFFVSLEKDPQQEDFLHGRMLGNPYSSSEQGIGPLMKDIKNKICQDCELLALLEDDSSMELLVSNKIISLDLPVREVYKRIWCVDNHENDAMRIIYRMRGLLGDATEEFIDSLHTHNSEDVDEEQVYKMANVMSSCGGLEVMLNRLKQIDDLPQPLKPLLDVILRLFNFCTKTKQNRMSLITSEMRTVKTFLGTLKLALNEDEFLELTGLPKGFMYLDVETSRRCAFTKPLQTSSRAQRTQVVDQILTILETIFMEASKLSSAEYQAFCSETCGSIEDLQLLLRVSLILSLTLPEVSHKVIKLLPYLTLGIEDKMRVLVGHFKQFIDYNQFDKEHSTLGETEIDLFCVMLDAIEHNENGNQLKDYILSEGIITKSLEYLTIHAPPLRSSLLATSEEWKNFTLRPALKYMLRILTGLSRGHPASQLLISRDCIHIVHGLEQVSSDSRVGTLAENLLEAIKQHPAVAEKIELVRRQTKEEKKRLAMAVRERQLGALGMKANERGQVIAKSNILDQCLDLAEDSGLICNICREGYKYQPSKVLGIYTYTKRCLLDEFELKRKTYGYTTVTHFNIVHVECHMSAVRSARSREEWDSAALQNANTRCNGLLPVWGPQVAERDYASALARHNNYLQDSTGCRDIGYKSTIHDIRLQLLRFAQERSFSEDTGGGGAQSNMHLLPYMIQTTLYGLNSTKASSREYKRTLNYLDISSSEMLENCYDVESPYYWIVLALMVLSPGWWKKKRIQFLQRLLICNHVRRGSIKPPASMTGTRVRSYAYYKSGLIFFAIIDGFYNIVFKDANLGDRADHDWSLILADYLKHNDQTVNDNIEILLNLYQNSLLPCSSIERFFEIIPIDEVLQPNEFLESTLGAA